MTAQQHDADGINVKTFEEVDDASKVQDYIRILDDFDRLSGIQTLKKAAIERCQIRPGMSVLDVGCGTGLETVRLARLVAPSGHVTGVDLSDDLLAEARRRASGLGLPIDYRQGNAEQLPLPDHAFDIARAERLLLYLDDPAKAVAELVRVTKPNGIVYVIEPDFETVTINLDDRSVVRKVLHFDCDNDTKDGWIGRQLPRMFRAAGLIDVVVETGVVIFDSQEFSSYFLEIGRAALQNTVITATEHQYWQSGIEDLLSRDELFCTITYFMVLGRVPAA
ncbi:MAG: methyltransferase domain-containing protein [Dehalococcoidia bacterium]